MYGIISVLNTPFTADNAIDFSGLRKNVSNAIDAGVAGFLVPALASEVGELSPSERHAIVDSVIEEASGRVPVIGGASAETQSERVQHTHDLTRLGCEGVLVNLPFDSEAQYEANLVEIAEAQPGFIMVQDWDPSGTGLPIELILHLFESIPKFKWLKIEVVPAGPKYTQVIEATEGRLKVAGGWAVMQMIDGLEREVNAFMPTAMHSIYATIYTRFHSGDHAGAQDLFSQLLPVIEFSNQGLDISIQFFKRLLHAQGIYATANVRADTQPFDEAQSRSADELIGRVIRIEESLRIDS
ncbi:dihydrodipicolinate synthase family protein [bacterium AH-315-P07]|nr:dihydrodipicolinate synthase family protein [bacterium AH-315-P07]